MDTTNTTTALTNAVSLPGQGRGQAVMGVTQIYKSAPIAMYWLVSLSGPPAVGKGVME
jgi:hypothetical protein